MRFFNGIVLKICFNCNNYEKKIVDYKKKINFAVTTYRRIMEKSGYLKMQLFCFTNKRVTIENANVFNTINIQWIIN